MYITLWNMNIIFLGEKERTKHNGYELSISALSPSRSQEFNIIPLAAINESAHSSMLLAISLLEIHQTFAVLGAPLEIPLSGLSRADTDPSGICLFFICGDWHILIKILENLPAAENSLQSHLLSCLSPFPSSLQWPYLTPAFVNLIVISYPWNLMSVVVYILALWTLWIKKSRTYLLVIHRHLTLWSTQLPYCKHIAQGWDPSKGSENAAALVLVSLQEDADSS